MIKSFNRYIKEKWVDVEQRTSDGMEYMMNIYKNPSLKEVLSLPKETEKFFSADTNRTIRGLIANGGKGDLFVFSQDLLHAEAINILGSRLTMPALKIIIRTAKLPKLLVVKATNSYGQPTKFSKTHTPIVQKNKNLQNLVAGGGILFVEEWYKDVDKFDVLSPIHKNPSRKEYPEIAKLNKTSIRFWITGSGAGDVYAFPGHLLHAYAEPAIKEVKYNNKEHIRCEFFHSDKTLIWYTDSHALDASKPHRDKVDGNLAKNKYLQRFLPNGKYTPMNGQTV